MKYQIYLKKDVSEVINTISKVSNQKPATFIKEFIERCFDFTAETLGQEAIKEITDYGKDK